MKELQLWLRIRDAQLETITPYFLHKDRAEKKEVQSDEPDDGSLLELCNEISDHTSADEAAVCKIWMSTLMRSITITSSTTVCMTLYIL